MCTCSSKLPFSRLLHDDRVVEIARRLSIDCHNGQSAEVAPLVDFVSGNDGLGILRFGQHGGRKAMRQMMLADHDLDVDAEIVFVAQNLHHPPARVLRGRRPVGDLDIHHDVFQVIPGCAPRRFLPQHAMRTSSCPQVAPSRRRSRGHPALAAVGQQYSHRPGTPDTPCPRVSRSPA